MLLAHSSASHTRVLHPLVCLTRPRVSRERAPQVEEVGQVESAKALLKVAKELAAATSGHSESDESDEEMVDAQLVEQLELGG